MLSNGCVMYSGEYGYIYSHGYGSGRVTVVGVRREDLDKYLRVYERSFVGCLGYKSENISNRSRVELSLTRVTGKDVDSCLSEFVRNVDEGYSRMCYGVEPIPYLVDLESGMGCVVGGMKYLGKEVVGISIKGTDAAVDFSSVLKEKFQYRGRELSLLEYLLLSRYYEGSKYMLITVDSVNKVLHADSVKATVDVELPEGSDMGRILSVNDREGNELFSGDCIWYIL